MIGSSTLLIPGRSRTEYGAMVSAIHPKMNLARNYQTPSSNPASITFFLSMYPEYTVFSIPTCPQFRDGDTPENFDSKEGSPSYNIPL